MTVAFRAQDERLTSADLTALVYGQEAQRIPLGKVCCGQLGKHKVLLRAVVRLGAVAVPAARSALGEHYNLLAAAEKRAPEAVTDVLRHPHVGAWAARCVRQLWQDPGSAPADLGYLGAIAVSAAIRAGHPCSLTLELRDGTLTLPTLGRAVLPGPHATVTVRGPAETSITAGDQTVVISPGSAADAAGWQAVRRLRFGDRQLLLDDLDPNRSYDPYPLPDRLDTADVARWQNALDEAWRLLSAYHPGYAAALQEGLRSLVPIGQRADDRNVSATSGDAFGAVAASIPSSGPALAVALVHEFQHAKLCAITDLEPLFQRKSRHLFYAPWRPDPRPADALLQGIFAHMAVADFWRVHRGVALGRERLIANVEFARWLRQTDHAARLLLDRHDVLTAAGRRLLSDVTARLTGWLEEPVPEPARKLAEETALDHLSCWRLRNLSPDPDDVGRLTADWLAGRAAHGNVRTRVRGTALTAGRNVRPDLLYLKLRDPEQFGLEEADSDVPDVAYARGEHAAAARGYLAQLRADPARLHAWTGLGITTDQRGSLVRFPEVVYAVNDRLAQLPGSRVDPLRLAGWLDGISATDLEVQV
jgi:HEXXH motif-containing protein